MKYYEIDAMKSDNRLVERFFEDGRRFIKYIPFNPKIVAVLKEQFKNKPIDVELKGTWIVITKTGFDEQFARAGKSLVGDDEVTIGRIAKEEVKMLTKAGYRVKLIVGDTDGQKKGN